MGDEDVSCHSVRDRESLNPGFIISGVADSWTSAQKGNKQPGLALWHHPSLVATSKPVTFLFYLHMEFASFDVDSYTRGGRDFSKNICCGPLVPCFPTPFSFLVKAPGIAKWHVLNTQRSWLKIPEHVLISVGASSPGAAQTLSHLSLKTPCEVRCGPAMLFQKVRKASEERSASEVLF